MHTLGWIAAAVLTTLICGAVARAGDADSGSPWRIALTRLRDNHAAFIALCDSG